MILKLGAKSFKRDLSGARELRRALIFSVGASVALSAFLIGLFIIQISSLIRLSEDTDKSNKIIASVIALQKTAINMDTEIRGYHLTRKKRFLEFFEDEKRSFPGQLGPLSALFENNLIYYHQMDEVKALMERWFKLQDRWNWDRATVEEVKSKRMMDQIREITSGILDQENKNLESDKAKRISNAHDTIVYGIFLVVVVGFALAMTIRRQMLRLFWSYDQNYNEMIAVRRELEELNRDLENKIAERTTSLKAVNDELETFCYSVSHDLRAPLRGIDGFSQALLEDYSSDLDENGKKYLNFIREGVQRMGHLIDDLLRLSRINRSAVQFEYFDILELVAEVIEAVKVSPENSRVQFVIQADTPRYVYADRGLLRILLENLYGNALKYTAKTLSPKVEFGSCGSSPQNDCFYISDNGVGFDMNHAGKLFSAFQRLHSDKDYPGTGIGLATVKRIVTRHGGKIWAAAKPSEGATFYFKIGHLNAEAKGGANVRDKDHSAR